MKTFSIDWRKADQQTIEAHVQSCDTPACQSCREISARLAEENKEWLDEFRADLLTREQGEDYERDAYDEAEHRRDLGLDDNDRSDFCSDDLRMGDLPR